MELTSIDWLNLLDITDSKIINEIILITVLSLISWIAWRILIVRLEKMASKTRIVWDDAVLHGITTPVSTLIWLWPGTVSLGLMLEEYFDHRFDWLYSSKLILIIFMVVWALSRVITNFESQILERQGRDVTTVQAIAKLIRLVVIIIGMLTIMQTLGLSISGLLTFGGVGGLIAGLAAKDLLSNFFGGMMIYFDRPFKIGEWIRSPDRSIEGTVERIGWRMTKIRTFDKRPLYVPNSVFSSIVVENPSRMHNRRIYETIGLRYSDSDKIDKVIGDVQHMLKNHPDIDANQTLMVNFTTFGPSSLDFFIYAFTKTVNWARFHEVKQDVLLQVMQIIHDNEADIAFPTQTLKIEELPEHLISHQQR
ncbi:mechanosensitive ion channel protein MscS [Vibrio sp. UCD-FRSSP16_10]|uniref:mechanosensitive ion channel family protein n=1 Tax=unclassified Vibrio TaxID=2614977 RepID=UPI0007FCA57A|nr:MULTISPECIES: mechanosensitive ion channel family protein [unclassified Vibrio]OBT16988.1 mechanosensitive ion channel protein MscS [Vibrio sp. UCD-FRSSP16_30]OBT21979.1 mechanosensitive ion channel protein MscS [Vibrio sp. UCD-FRSSP16_10]